MLEPKSINLRIREDPSQGYFVAGLKQIAAHSAEDCLRILEMGEKQRSYRATNIHEHSSRSHSVFRILIESKELEGIKMDEDKKLHLKGTVKFSLINLVDLAGSERMNEVGDSNETSYINKSLFILTNVINKLSESPAGHIPFRDSKLTRILSNSLGGNALTSVICTIAPDISHMQLSLSTLRFAMRTKCIRNQPIINEVQDDAALLVAYKNRISQLENQLVNVQTTKDAEIAKLKKEIKDRSNDLIDSSSVENSGKNILEFVNMTELEYFEKYKELQKNYKRILEQKKTVLAQLDEFKQIGMIGFDIQRTEFENSKDCSKIEKWDEECNKLRNLYLMELAGFDERYSNLIKNLYASLNKPHSRKSSIPKPPPKTSTRPKSQKSTQRVDNYRIRKMNTVSNRDRARVQTFETKFPLKEKTQSPSPFMLVCEDLSTQNEELMDESSHQESIIGISHQDTILSESIQDPIISDSIQDPNIGKTQDSFQSNDDIPSENIKYNPPPCNMPETVSENSVAINTIENSNILLFGYNKDGCCSGERFTAENVYYSLKYEYQE